MRPFLSFFFLFLFYCAFAQSPQIQSVFPANQHTHAAPEVVLQVDFNMPMDDATLIAKNINIFGRWSGPTAATFGLSEDKRSLTMILSEPLMYGEWVTVNLSKNIRSAEGIALEMGYVWNFWVKTLAYEFDTYQTQDVIELRQAGEGLVQAYGAYAGDLDNDGYSDLTVINENSDDLRILLNDGTGQYGNFEIVELNSGQPSPNEGADFDQDGEIDLAVSTAHQNQLRVLFGDGNGSLSDMDSYTTGTSARGLGVIDLEGDGYDDIVIANRASSDMTLLLNDGQGQFSATTIDPPGEGESGLVVTDLNNDGIQDVVLGMYTSQEIVVLLGDGAMGFTAATPVSVNGRPWMLATGDLNNDGYADVVSANSSGNNVAVLLNDGSGNLQAPSYIIDAQANFPIAIDLGDLDGDGDLDVVPSYYASTNFGVFLNDGTGVFELFEFLHASTYASCAILHDRDNDGALDITGIDEGDDLVFLFVGMGNVSAGNEPTDARNISVYPNPSHGQDLQLDVPDGLEVLGYQVVNVNGQVLIKAEWSIGSDRALPVGKLPEGIYFLQTFTSEGVMLSKVVRSR